MGKPGKTCIDKNCSRKRELLGGGDLKTYVSYTLVNEHSKENGPFEDVF